MLCLGCGIEFQRIRRHFSETSHQPCLEFSRQLKDNALQTSLNPLFPLESNSSPNGANATSSTSQHAVNNEFGDVTMTFDPFDMFDRREQTDLHRTPSPGPASPISNGNKSSSDSDSETDVDEQDAADLYDAECEKAWEEPIEMVDLRLPLTPDVETVILPLDSNRSQLPTASIGSSPISNLPSVQTSRPHIVRYPNRQAGAPVAGKEAGNSDHEEYHRNLKGGGNIWAPFKSELDWRLARWAKMRGPGSTAFTELLDIPGVSLHYSMLVDHSC